MTSQNINMLRQKKMHLSCLIPFPIRKKYVILAINIVITQIALLITSLPSGTGFYVMRWVKYGGLEQYHFSSQIQDFVFFSSIMG